MATNALKTNKRKLETTEVTEGVNDNDNENGTDGAPLSKKRRINGAEKSQENDESNSKKNEETSNSNTNKEKKDETNGFSFSSGFSFGSESTFSSTAGFSFDPQSTQNTDTNGAFSFVNDTTINDDSNADNKETNSISAWSTSANESNPWKFDSDIKFNFSSFGSNEKSTFGSNFGSGFGGFGNDSNSMNNNDNNNNASNDENDENVDSNPFEKNTVKIEMAGAVDPGDTNDVTHFHTKCKIFKLKKGQWKEKGIGEIRVNSVKHRKDIANAINSNFDDVTENENNKEKEKEKDKDTEKESDKKEEKEVEMVIDSARLICRREKIGKLILNEFIQKDTKYEIENKKFLRISFVSARSENNSDNEEEEETNESKDKTKTKSNEDENEFVVNTYLIKLGDPSKLEELTDAIEVVKEMLVSPKSQAKR